MNCDLVYYKKKNEPLLFRAVVHDCALDHLISDAHQAHRVYEFLSITRPGDVCKYLWVELVEVPGWVRSRAAEQRAKTKYPVEKEWPDHFVPLVEFDRYFYWAWDDTEPEHECWLTHRDGGAFLGEIRRLFQKIGEAQQLLRVSEDPLIRIQVERMEKRSHPCDIKPETPFLRTRPDYKSPTIPERSSAYYDKLREMLSRPDLESLALSGEAWDYQMLRVICTEQRVRAEASGKNPYDALPVSMSYTPIDWSLGWGVVINRYYEGMGYGDMWILDEDDSGDHMKSLVEDHGYFHRWFFFYRGAEDIRGYRRLEGDGWTLLEDETEERDYRRRGKASLEARFRRMTAHGQAEDS